MSFKFRYCSLLFCFLLLWRFQKTSCYVDFCDQSYEAVYCTCDTAGSETSVTCFVYGDLQKTDIMWDSLSMDETVVALTLQSRLPKRLDYIPSDSLKKMQDLQSFVVQEGDLGPLKSYSVSNMSSLRKLELDRNEISSLERNAIFNLTRLKKLALSENLLTELLADSMVRLGELEKLFLDRNNISRIESCAFCDLQNLKELELWGNKITDLTEYTFRGLRYLNRLDLYMNQITILNNKVFHTMPRLLEIDLKDNLIEYIAPHAFSGLDNLQRLLLNQNRLKKLDNKVFKSLPGLRSVDISFNQLEALQGEVLHNMAHAKNEHFTFSFRENPLKCDCHLQWVRSYLKINKSHQFTRELQELTCLTTEGESQHAKHLKLNCDKPRSPSVVTAESTSPSKAKQRSFINETMQAEAKEVEDVVLADVDHGSGGLSHVSDLKMVFLAVALAMLLNCRRESW